MTGAARNVEIKARIDSVEALLARAQPLADGPPQPIRQDDSFFTCAHGRLKLRDFGDGRGELIQYQRADDAGPKTSTYVRSPTAAPDSLREALARSLGLVGRVRKQRLLLLAGRTRIHLDRVEGLGDFLELEVVLRDGEDEAAGLAEAQALMQRLGIAPAQLVRGAYLDLLLAGGCS
ncbi:MAG: class IV adenylate cyclase [Piscinibacter sp.]|nr:class IV adenylate cyclase [Piscinibacter sp.]